MCPQSKHHAYKAEFLTVNFCHYMTAGSYMFCASIALVTTLLGATPYECANMGCLRIMGFAIGVGCVCSYFHELTRVPMHLPLFSSVCVCVCVCVCELLISIFVSTGIFPLIHVDPMCIQVPQ
ncbi:unnamed protein product [Pipistrellus nathusii]|uniref:Transmembrane protein n=1 Tax=Pipistrellus nathusii TaxID=59473 RepID=A0ABP0AHS6_PIPNA